MGQWRRFTVITWSDSNCNAPRTRRDADYVLTMQAVSRAVRGNRSADLAQGRGLVVSREHVGVRPERVRVEIVAHAVLSSGSSIMIVVRLWPLRSPCHRAGCPVSAVEPRSFRRRGSAPARRGASSADFGQLDAVVSHRRRRPRWGQPTDERGMTSGWRVGLQLAAPGTTSGDLSPGTRPCGS
jgi:hypothetical protein